MVACEYLQLIVDCEIFLNSQLERGDDIRKGNMIVPYQGPTFFNEV